MELLTQIHFSRAKSHKLINKTSILAGFGGNHPQSFTITLKTKKKNQAKPDRRFTHKQPTTHKLNLKSI